MSDNLKTTFSSIEEAHAYLKSLKYQSVDNRFWYIPNTRKWAFFTESTKSVAFFVNVLRGSSLTAKVVAKTTPKRRKTREEVHG